MRRARSVADRHSVAGGRRLQARRPRIPCGIRLAQALLHAVDHDCGFQQRFPRGRGVAHETFARSVRVRRMRAPARARTPLGGNGPTDARHSDASSALAELASHYARSCAPSQGMKDMTPSDLVRQETRHARNTLDIKHRDFLTFSTHSLWQTERSQWQRRMTGLPEIGRHGEGVGQ